MNIALLHKILLILWPALFFLNDSVMGQFKMGDQSTKNRFTVVKSDSNLTRQWYKPKTDKVVFYNGVTGKKDYLSRWDGNGQGLTNTTLYGLTIWKTTIRNILPI